MPKSKNATMRSLAEHLADLDDPAPKGIVLLYIPVNLLSSTGLG